MRVVAYYVTRSVWVGGLSSCGGVIMFTLNGGGLGLTGLGCVCIIEVVRLRDKESS